MLQNVINYTLTKDKILCISSYQNMHEVYNGLDAEMVSQIDITLFSINDEITLPSFLIFVLRLFHISLLQKVCLII